MTQTQIRYFLEVAKCRNFSKAAINLFVTQPAVSRQISLLEKELDTKLFERQPQGLDLTKAGELLCEFFTEFELSFHDTLAKLHEYSTDKQGHVTLGCLDGWDTSIFYPEICDIINDKYPQIKLSMNGYNHASIIDALKDNAIDVAITLEMTVPNSKDITIRTVTSAPAVALISATNPLAEKKDLTLNDLADEPFYVISPNSDSHNPMENLCYEICNEFGFTPKTENINSSNSVLMNLQSGRGVQITCAWTSACDYAPFRILELPKMLNICAVWRAEAANSAAHIFIDELYKNFRKKLNRP